jgi:hypothetical protein
MAQCPIETANVSVSHTLLSTDAVGKRRIIPSKRKALCQWFRRSPVGAAVWTRLVVAHMGNARHHAVCIRKSGHRKAGVEVINAGSAFAELVFGSARGHWNLFSFLTGHVTCTIRHLYLSSCYQQDSIWSIYIAMSHQHRRRATANGMAVFMRETCSAPELQQNLIAYLQQQHHLTLPQAKRLTRT